MQKTIRKEHQVTSTQQPRQHGAWTPFSERLNDTGHPSGFTMTTANTVKETRAKSFPTELRGWRLKTLPF